MCGTQWLVVVAARGVSLLLFFQIKHTLWATDYKVLTFPSTYLDLLVRSTLVVFKAGVQGESTRENTLEYSWQTLILCPHSRLYESESQEIK